MNKQVKPSLNAPKDSSDKALEIAGISQKAEERKRRKKLQEEGGGKMAEQRLGKRRKDGMEGLE